MSRHLLSWQSFGGSQLFHESQSSKAEGVERLEKEANTHRIPQSAMMKDGWTESSSRRRPDGRIFTAQGLSDTETLTHSPGSKISRVVGPRTCGDESEAVNIHLTKEEASSCHSPDPAAGLGLG